MESRNLSIMLTDIEGYTAKSTNSSREALTELIRTHTSLLVPVIQFYKGRIVKSMGDAFLCVFDSATDAAVCSIAIRMILNEFNRRQKDEEKRLNVRVIINSGDVTLDENDIFGEAVNVVSRMEKLPEFAGGGIGLSESTYLLVNRREINADLIGDFEFKGIPHRIKVYSLDLSKQKLDRLPTKLFELVNQVASGKKISIDWFPQEKTVRMKLDLKMAAIFVLFLFMIIAGFFYRNYRSQMHTAATWIHRSDPTQQHDIMLKDFVGPRRLSGEIDENDDGVLTREEIGRWLARHHTRLPPPEFPPAPASK